LRGTRHSNGALAALPALPLLPAIGAYGGRLLDRGPRKALYRELQLRAARDLPYVSLCTGMSIAVHDSRLTGVEAMNPTADFSFLPGLGRR